MQEIKDTNSYRQLLREKIMETAMSEFTKQGIRAVKMDDLSRQLGISKRTLYEIYNDKEELLFQCVSHYDMQKQASLRQYSDTHNVIETIIKAYHLKVKESKMVCPAFFEDILKYPKVRQYIHDERERGQRSFRLFMERGVTEGLFRQELDYELISHLFDAIGNHIMNNRLMQQFSIEKLFVNLFLVSLRGMCTPLGIKNIDEAIVRIQ